MDCIFDEMTKEEIVHWIKESFLFLDKPKRSWLYFYRWRKKSLALQEAQDKHMSHRVSNLAKRDEYARQFNAATDIDEKVRFMDLMKPFHDKLKVWVEEGKALDRKQDCVDALYARSEKEWKKERNER